MLRKEPFTSGGTGPPDSEMLDRISYTGEQHVFAAHLGSTNVVMNFPRLSLDEFVYGEIGSDNDRRCMVRSEQRILLSLNDVEQKCSKPCQLMLHYLQKRLLQQSHAYFKTGIGGSSDEKRTVFFYSC